MKESQFLGQAYGQENYSENDIQHDRDTQNNNNINVLLQNREQTQHYLEFCRQLQPNQNEFGTIFQGQNIEQQALKFLEKMNYNFIKAKFILCFPIMSQHMKKEKLKIQCSEQEMIQYINEFCISQNLQITQYSHKHETIKRQINNILKGTLQVNFIEAKQIYEEAQRLRMQIPREFYESLQYSERLQNQISKMLQQQNRNIFKIQQLVQQSRNSLFTLNDVNILNEQFQDILNFRNEFSDIEKHPDDLQMNLYHQYQQKFKDLKLDPESDHKFDSYNRFSQKQQNAMKILSLKDSNIFSGSKIKMEQLCEAITFCSQNFHNNEEIHEILECVKQHEKLKEKSLMWVEDERNWDLNLAQMLIQKMKQCPIDFEEEFYLMYCKSQYIQDYIRLYQTQDDEKQIEQNRQLIIKLKKQRHQFFLKDILRIEEKFELIFQIDQKIENLHQIKITAGEFLFMNPIFMNWRELEQLLTHPLLLNVKNQYLINIKNFINDFKKKLVFTQPFKEIPLEQLYKKLQDILNYSLRQDEILVPLKNFLLQQLRLVYRFFLFIRRLTQFKQFEFPYESIENYFSSKIKTNDDLFKEKKFLDENLSVLNIANARIQYIQIQQKLDRIIQYIQCDNFDQIQNDRLYIHQLYEQNFQNQELLHKIQIKDNLLTLTLVLNEIQNQLKNSCSSQLLQEIKKQTDKKKYSEQFMIIKKIFEEHSIINSKISEDFLNIIYDKEEDRQKFSVCHTCIEQLVNTQKLQFIETLQQTHSRYIDLIKEILAIYCRSKQIFLTTTLSQKINEYFKIYIQLEQKFMQKNKISVKSLKQYRSIKHSLQLKSSRQDLFDILINLVKIAKKLVLKLKQKYDLIFLIKTQQKQKIYDNHLINVNTEKIYLTRKKQNFEQNSQIEILSQNVICICKFKPQKGQIIKSDCCKYSLHKNCLDFKNKQWIVFNQKKCLVCSLVKKKRMNLQDQLTKITKLKAKFQILSNVVNFVQLESFLSDFKNIQAYYNLLFIVQNENDSFQKHKKIFTHLIQIINNQFQAKNIFSIKQSNLVLNLHAQDI